MARKSRRKSRKRRSPYGNWKRKAPKRTSARRKMLKKHGKKCFLMPGGIAANSYRPMFPVCDKNGKYNCGGIRAARTRAAEWKYVKVKARANRLGKRLGCDWAKMSMCGSPAHMKWGKYGFSGSSSGAPVIMEEELIAVRRSPVRRRRRKSRRRRRRRKSRRKPRRKRRKSRSKRRRKRRKSRSKRRRKRRKSR